MNVKILFPILCLATAGLALPAAQTEAGVQASLVFPQNALRTATDGSIGFQVGFQEGVDLGGGNEVRGRIDYTRVDGGSFHLSSLNSTTTVQGLGVGADYLRYLEDRRRGFYAFGGLALDWWFTHYRFTSGDRTTTPTLRLGIGHRFDSNFGVEFGADWGQFRSDVGSFTNLKAGVTYRF